MNDYTRWMNELESRLQSNRIEMVDLPTFDIDADEYFRKGVLPSFVVELVMFLLVYENESLRGTGIECAD